MICTTADELIASRLEGQTLWIATLDDGTTVYQDDDRDGISPPSAWLRLREHCRVNSRHIVRLFLRFRSHVEHLPENADGYFFCKAALGVFGNDHTQHFYVVGSLKNGILTVDKWKIPELIRWETETREYSLDDECLIYNGI